MTLEQQLIDLLAKHDLDAVSLHVTLVGEEKRPYVYANVHANRVCASNPDTPGTFEGALGSAIGELNVKRTPPVVAVDALQPMQEAA